MKYKSILKNYIIYLLNLFIDIFFPLILSPYITRVLGAENLGEVNLANSISAMFVLIIAFGIPLYGVREIAKVKDDSYKLSKVFSELFILRCILTFIGSVIFILVIILTPRFHTNISLYVAMLINLIFYAFSVDWFYQGLEKYHYLTIRNLLFKIVMFILTIILVKNTNDYIKYAYIQVFSLGIFNIINLIKSFKFVKFKKRKLDLVVHIKALKFFFLGALVTSIYTTFDQVLIGFMLKAKYLAFYSRGRQVISMALTATLALSTVLMPRISFFYENNKKQFYKMVNKSINCILLITIPLFVGIMLLSKEVMLFFGGNEFIEGRFVISILSIVIILDSIYVWATNQILIPSGNEKKSFKIQVIMAICSLTFNIVFINLIGVEGAAVSFVFTELIGLILSLYCVKHLVNIKIINKSTVVYIISSFIMAIIVIIIKLFIKNYLVIIFMSIGIGSIAYFTCVILLKDPIFKDLLSILNKSKYRKKLDN